MTLSGIAAEMVKKAIKKCHWRKKVAGIDICAGVCLPCEKAINDGKCDILLKAIKSKGEVNDNE